MAEVLNVKKNPLSILMFVLCAAVFSYAQLTDHENVRFLAFDYAALPERWYAIVTYGFVHVDWNHIIINMLLLAWSGIWVERMIGSKRFLLVVLCGIFAGGLSLYVRETAGIGFSAAAAALLFYYHLAFPMQKELPFNIPNVVLPAVLFVLSVAGIVFGWLPSVGHYPHLAGALVGAIFLLLFKKHHRPI